MKLLNFLSNKALNALNYIFNNGYKEVNHFTSDVPNSDTEFVLLSEINPGELFIFDNQYYIPIEVNDGVFKYTANNSINKPVEYSTGFRVLNCISKTVNISLNENLGKIHDCYYNFHNFAADKNPFYDNFVLRCFPTDNELSEIIKTAVKLYIENNDKTHMLENDFLLFPLENETLIDYKIRLQSFIETITALFAEKTLELLKEELN